MKNHAANIHSIVTLIVLVCTLPLTAADVLIPTGATWKYLDNGSDQGTAWRTPAFNDTAWASGPAQLGYGDGDEATVVSYGPNSGAKYITTYFRRSFNVADASAYLNATVRVLRDDGAVVYVNGTEVFRSNMPGGGVGYQTLASAAIDDNTFYSASFSPSLLVDGANVVAVEIHQANGTSSDLSFDLELTASTTVSAPVVVRGPYLQSGTPNSVVVRWRTDLATDSRVCFGTVQGTLSTCVSDATPKTEHVITLTGLSADTRYYYSVGNAAGVLAGNDANHFVVTHPPAGVGKPTRIWVLGDAGTATSSQQAVRNAYYTFTGSRHTDLWLMLGDNAYSSGTDAQFQAAVFNMYPEMLRKSVLWSTRGNHESTDASGSVYYNLHTFPTAGQAGGEPSGTEAYYSWDYGNIHFICLDSFGSSRSATGPMANWLNADLAANTRPWTIALWHHPPYTKGSHNSDNEIELIEMRQNFLPILEDAGVDLVLCGHSHSYERSFLLDGHYGSSSTLTAANKLDGGSGREDGTGAYTKATEGSAPHEGAVYVVAGSSGQTSGGTLNHPAMFISLNNLGSLVVDVDTNRMDVKFLRETGAIGDYFTLIKGGAVTPPSAPTGLTATPGNAQVLLSWSATSGATSYNVKRATVSGGPYTTIATGVTSTTFTNTGLNNGTTYYFVVSASNSGGEGPDSAQVNATPQAPAAPNAPTALTATGGKNKITLRWTQSTSPNLQYNRVYRSNTSGGPYTLVAQFAPKTSYNDPVAGGQTRYYVVTAVNTSGGESALSNQASATAK
jgi:hypothetical protein